MGGDGRGLEPESSVDILCAVAIDAGSDKTADACDAGIGSSIVAVDTANGPPNVVLTYDDGPQPGGTDAVLSALSDAGASATFFVLLSRVRRYPSLLMETLAEGHEIALHGPDHKRLTDLDPAEVVTRTLAARRALEDVTGHQVRWFRPPYGSQTSASWSAVTQAGLTTALWSADFCDWRDDVPDDLRLRPAHTMTKPGSVLLLHDGFATDIDGVDDGPPPQIDRGALTRSIIEICTAKGFTCSSLAQALRTGTAVNRIQLG
jgi:peptidoglycan/xylan/chitin deacetylase (PgdA/CDA1 family)